MHIKVRPTSFILEGSGVGENGVMSVLLKKWNPMSKM